MGRAWQQEVGDALVVGGDALGEGGGARVQLGAGGGGHLLQDAGTHDRVLDAWGAVAEGGQAAGHQRGTQPGLGDGVRPGEGADQREVEQVAADGEGAQGVDRGGVAQVAQSAGGVVADDLGGERAQRADVIGAGAVSGAGETVQHVVDDGRDAPGGLGEDLREGGVPGDFEHLQDGGGGAAGGEGRQGEFDGGGQSGQGCADVPLGPGEGGAGGAGEQGRGGPGQPADEGFQPPQGGRVEPLRVAHHQQGGPVPGGGEQAVEPRQASRLFLGEEQPGGQRAVLRREELGHHAVAHLVLGGGGVGGQDAQARLPGVLGGPAQQVVLAESGFSRHGDHRGAPGPELPDHGGEGGLFTVALQERKLDGRHGMIIHLRTTAGERL
ncbi:hypothetical protein SDIAM26S_05617 [Streptomyces diastaticus subsp. diastaticus]